MQEVLDIVAGFRGALQLLPKPGFVDTCRLSPGEETEGGQRFDYQNAETWADFKGKVRDLWFGDGRCATPTQPVLDAGSWLWKKDGERRPSLPDRLRGQELLCVRRRAQHALRRARRRRPPEDGGHARMATAP